MGELEDGIIFGVDSMIDGYALEVGGYEVVTRVLRVMMDLSWVDRKPRLGSRIAARRKLIKGIEFDSQPTLLPSNCDQMMMMAFGAFQILFRQR